MKKLLLTTLLGSVVLTGCGDGMPPKCDSKDTKNSLTKILTQAGIQKPIITSQKTLSADKESKQYLCQAYISDGRLASRFIKYSVFWGDEDQKLFYVQLVE